MKFCKFLSLMLTVAAVSVFTIGCGAGDSEATPDNDPVASDPASDPALEEPSEDGSPAAGDAAAPTEAAEGADTEAAPAE